MAVVILNPTTAVIGPNDTIGLTLTPSPGTTIVSAQWVQTNPIGTITPGATPNIARFKPTSEGTTGIYANVVEAPL